jgi:hypothetical protein
MPGVTPIFNEWISEEHYLEFTLDYLRLRLGEGARINAKILDGTAAEEAKKRKIEHPSEWISERHRLWGVNAPMLNNDWFSFLVIEYDNGKAVALVEYKHRREKEMERSQRSALTDLGTRANLPTFIVKYDDEEIRYFIIPLFIPKVST